MSTPRSLYLCRTQFQLLMCQRIVARLPDETADLCYMTNADSEKDRYYFGRASSDFERVEYRVVGPKWDIAAFVFGMRRHWIFTTDYDRLYLGNHTLSHFRHLVNYHSNAHVATFDEGSGNFDQDGALHVDGRSRLERIRDLAFGIPPISGIFARSEKHYTVNAELQNVVDPSLLEEVDLITLPDSNALVTGAINLVIGQPFEEVLTRSEQTLLLDAYSRLTTGQYIQHPREIERSAIIRDLEIVNDKRIIEDYLSDVVASGHRVRLIGPFSTTFFTVNSPMIEKFYLHASSRTSHPGLAAKVGCRVFDLKLPSESENWASLARSWGSWDPEGSQNAP